MMSLTTPSNLGHEVAFGLGIRICVNHLGFRPVGHKQAVVLASGPSDPREFSIREVGTGRLAFRGAVRYREDPLGFGGVAEFSELTEPGLYQIRIGETRSVPFFIRNDVYTRTAYDVFHYFHIQRCGQAVPGWHDACHLDDARRRDTGEHVDVVGGWHDAGDLRKWMSATLWAAIAMCWVKRYWGSTWTRFSSDDLLDEIRWGNAYFLKMHDSQCGRVWHDTAGGVNGDNSDNHWTDNVIGTDDDRYVETERVSPLIQWTFVYLQALVAQTFKEADPGYSRTCLDAAVSAYEYALTLGPGLDTLSLGMKVLALVELVRARSLPGAPAHALAECRGQLDVAIDELVARQIVSDGPGKGAFRASGAADAPIFRHAWLSGIPSGSLLVAHAAGFGNLVATRQAIERYVYEYIKPLTELSAFRILPYSVWREAPTPDRYRPLPQGGVYRFFMPVLEEGQERRPVRWWVGTTSHLLSHSLVLALASRQLQDPSLQDLAVRQIEWVAGANPFQASLITGHGVNQPWPHSRFVGLIPGGIMNGIGGDEQDEPVLDQENGLAWQTNEYWSPHNAFYLMTLAALEERENPAPTIGIIPVR